MDEIGDNSGASSEISDSQTVRMITVKFATPDGKVFTQSYADQTVIRDIKRVLADVFNLPFESLTIKKDGHTVCDYKRLEQFPAGDYNILEFGIASTKPSRFVLADDAYELNELPDVITVHVEDSEEEEGYRDVVVEIIDRKIEKPFLGGYVHKENGTEYHHGYSQTGPCKPKVGPENKTHRDTQTYFLRNRLLDTKYARATQMPCSNVWIPNVTDRIMTAMPYETAEEREKRLAVERKVRTIQRYFRAWKIRKGLKILSAEYKKRIFLEQEMIRFDLEDKENSKKREIIGKVFPRTKYDFFMLYAMVDRWKKSEIKRITNTYSGPAKVTAFYVLLDKEVQMLRAIENHRQNIKKDKKVEKEREFFETIKNPVTWNIYYKNWMEQYKDIHVEMDTLETQKGREYYKTFLSITNNNILDVNACFEALLNIKLSLHRHNCQLSNEFVSLIDRACELMARGFTNKQLDILMKRIQGLLLKHIQDPICNNSVTKRLLNVRERSMKGDLFYCNHCKKLKPHSSFAMHSGTDKFGLCLSCSWNNRIIQPWFDLAPYRYMLRWIRRKEQMERTPSLVPFILQDQDIHYIVTNIWHGHSAISEYNDVYNLRLCRWFRSLPWAPWNCVLLTVRESEAHLKIEDLKTVYDGHFLCRVFNKHELAKLHFRSVLKLEQHYRQIHKCNSEWEEIKEIVSDEFVNMFNSL